MITVNDVLADSSFLFSLFHSSTKQHDEVKKASKQIRGQLVVLDIILTEVAFLFRRVGGVSATSTFITAFVAGQRVWLLCILESCSDTQHNLFRYEIRMR